MSLPGWVSSDASLEGRTGKQELWSTSELGDRVEHVRFSLVNALGKGARVGLISDNSPTWIAIDLAAEAAGIDLVPLPGFFTAAQLQHALRVARVEAIFCPEQGLAASLGYSKERFEADGVRLFTAPQAPQWNPDGVHASEAHKITFTSGSTGTPKGVALTGSQQLSAARALADLAVAMRIQRHLCALPLAVLLENVAGVYTALTVGATCICPPLAEIGLSGSSEFDPERCLAAIGRSKPDSLILLPQMLRLLAEHLARRGGRDARLKSLRFVTVGGAKTPVALIERARSLGLPVYEGYGLTECASVVSVNAPGADRVGTVGRPLTGVQVRVAADGELEISGRAFAGYVGSEATAPSKWIASGDLGTVDPDGFISIVGRKKNIIVTSYGRNVSPEWPESLLLESPALGQAAVYGEARPHLTAVLVPASPQTDHAELESAVRRANLRLPDYARIHRWIRAEEPFTAENGLATSNGRVLRAAIQSRYAETSSAL